MAKASLATSVARLFFELDSDGKFGVLNEVLHPRLVEGLLVGTTSEQQAILKNYDPAFLFEKIDYYRTIGDSKIPLADYVYLIRAEGAERVKIGLSSNPFRRLTELQPQAPFPITLVAFRTGGLLLESKLHQQFADARLFGEWFKDLPEIEQIFS